MDSNGETTERGLFWLRENDKKRLWGTLYISEQRGITLETFGSLINPDELRTQTIVGRIRAGQQLVTLIDCFAVNTQDGFPWGDGEPDWSYQTCIANRLVDGIGFQAGEEIAFERAAIGISTLPKWVNPDLVKSEFLQSESGFVRLNISIEDRPTETTTVTYREQELRISLLFQPKQQTSSRIGGSRILVEDHCYLTLERTDGSQMLLESILSVAGIVLDLLSICCNEMSTITSLDVHFTRGDAIPAKLYVPTKGFGTETDKGYPRPALSYADIGGIEAVARWFKLKERYGEPAAILTSDWYGGTAYPEDSFSRMYTAVEGLLSRKKHRKSAKMNAIELSDFVEEAVSDSPYIGIGAIGEWAERVKAVRDQKIDHSDPSSTIEADWRSMHVMTNILYVAGVSFLLKEMGLDDEQVKEYIMWCSHSLLLKE